MSAAAAAAGLSPDALRSIPLLRGFTDDELATITALFSRIEPSGPLFREGDTADRLFLLTKGEVTLCQGDDDRIALHPPAVIGELGGLQHLARSSTATPTAGSEVWAIAGDTLSALFRERPAIGLRFQQNMLVVCGEKMLRDQARVKDMRANLIRTQKALKQMRDYLLESEDTTVSDRLHDMMEGLIQKNRRVNYRVNPPASLASTLRLDGGPVPVVEVSRTHVSYRADDGAVPAKGDRVSGVMTLSGPEIPISGVVIRAQDRRVTLELDLLIDQYTATLEGYLTRVQLVDFLV